MTVSQDFTLAELMIVAASEAFRGDPEQLGTGIGPLPKVAAGLAKMTHSPGMVLTDGEAMLTETPVPLGPRGDHKARFVGRMNYARVFEAVWSGRRHALVTPVQMDRWGQGNISALGSDFRKPKVQMLGVRGFPGNSVSHRNSMLFTSHNKRVFVEGEVDVVSSVGFKPGSWPANAPADFVRLTLVVTPLCVFDFGGPDHAAQVLSLHPGVSFEEVQENTGFPLLRAPGMGTTQAPTAAQMEIIRQLDPRNIRATVLKDNPPGIRPAA